MGFNYTIPNNKRELKLYIALYCGILHYTIPNNKRELKRMIDYAIAFKYYTIPNNKRELKLALYLPNLDTILYHTKQQKGTKTNCAISSPFFLLYHTKQQKGTKTPNHNRAKYPRIIPYQTTKGN